MAPLPASSSLPQDGLCPCNARPQLPPGPRCQQQLSTTMLPRSSFPSALPRSPGSAGQSPETRVFWDDNPSAAEPGRAGRPVSSATGPQGRLGGSGRLRATKPCCWRAGPSSLLPQGHLAPSPGCTSPRAGGIYPHPRVAGPGYGPARTFPHPAAMEPCCPARARPPNRTACPGGRGDAGSGCAGPGCLCTPRAQGREGLSPAGLRQGGCVQARQEEGPGLGKQRSEPPLGNCGGATQLGAAGGGCQRVGGVMPPQPHSAPLPPAQPSPRPVPLRPGDRLAPT